MGKVIEAFRGIARRTTTSFAELCANPWHKCDLPPEPVASDGLIYRLRHWPDLPASQRTADVLRLLSLMSNRPMNRSWMVSHTQLTAARLDRLLSRLVEQGAVEVIDASRFAAPEEQRARR